MGPFEVTRVGLAGKSWAVARSPAPLTVAHRTPEDSPESQSLISHSGERSDADLDAEYERLMQDIQGNDHMGDGPAASDLTKRLPPWRVDCLRKKGYY